MKQEKPPTEENTRMILLIIALISSFSMNVWGIMNQI